MQRGYAVAAGERYQLAPAGGQYHGGQLRFSVRYVKDLGEWDAKALLLRLIVFGRQIQRIEPNRSLQYHLSADLLELLHGHRMRIAEQLFQRRASGGKLCLGGYKKALLLDAGEKADRLCVSQRIKSRRRLRLCRERRRHAAIRRDRGADPGAKLDLPRV